MIKASRSIQHKKNNRKKDIAKGLVIIFFGKGKGKTSAALGIALRAAGWQFKVLIYQFIKGTWQSGERLAIEEFLPKVKIKAAGEGFVGILDDKLPKKIHSRTAQKAFSDLKKGIERGDWQLVVLDEILGAIEHGLIQEKEVLALIKQKPRNLHLVLTGHNPIDSLVGLADLVTEMKEIKHPFKSGIVAQKGIDF